MEALLPGKGLRRRPGTAVPLRDMAPDRPGKSPAEALCLQGTRADPPLGTQAARDIQVELDKVVQNSPVVPGVHDVHDDQPDTKHHRK